MIKNGKNTPLNENSGSLPDVSGALSNWFQNMSVSVLSKTIINFRVVESTRTVNFKGVMQPFTDQQYNQKDIGQRAWRWHTLHAETGLILNLDDLVIYSGLKYRVKSISDYNKYGYVKYEIIEDFT